MSELALKSIVEALLFSSDAPVTLDRLCSVLEGRDRSDIREAVETLASEYERDERAFTVAKVAGGWQLYARPEYSQWIRDLNRSRASTRLSQAALETLAIVAYKQPIVRAEVEGVRGVDSSGVLATLLKRDLIAIAGRAPGMGRALMYRTTREFLRYFGLDSVTDLPRLEEFAEVLGLKPEELSATVEGAESAGALAAPEETDEGSSGTDEEDPENQPLSPNAEGAASAEERPLPPPAGEHAANAGRPRTSDSAESAAAEQSGPSTSRVVAPTATEEEDEGGGARPPFSMHSVPDGEILTPLDED